jgi:DNA-binding MarR family transcriptional regulator
MSPWSVRLERPDRDRPLEAQEFVITESLGYLVNRAARSVAHDLARELRPAGIGIGQWAVLMFLWARDGMSQAELSRVVAIEPPTMVRTIDRMVRDGLVTRAPDPDDGRLSRIQLTERGRSLRDELVPKAIAVNEATLGRLTTAEGRTLRRLLDKLVSQPAPRPQLTAFFTSLLIFASSVAVSLVSANEVGHIAPSSRLASSLKPNVAYLELNFDAAVK